MSGTTSVLWAFIAFIVLLVLYIRANDRKITRLPVNYASLTTKDRCTPADVAATAASLRANPRDIKSQSPPKTGRKYIVVGGGGFLGGWITTQLLDRGEDPSHIRLIDIRPPPSSTLQAALNLGVQFIQTDISNSSQVLTAFTSPWSPSVPSDTEITVFHTAANIRFYERYSWQLPLSSKVNVDGTRNILNACLKIGASILVYTSSGSVGIRSNTFLLWPWQSSPKFFTQIIRDSDQLSESTRCHSDYFSNYAVSKSIAERLVRSANNQPCSGDHGKRVLRTGCLRPGNGIFGPRGDMLCGAYIVRKTNPTWIQNQIASHIYVENCALAHLLYEARLLPNSSPTTTSVPVLPDISGQAFNISDPGPPPTNGDVFTTLSLLTSNTCHFHFLSPTSMLLLSYLIEFYYTLPTFIFTYFRLPRITGNLINLQPSLFSLTQLHLIFDDSRARLPPNKGGLGYQGAWTTLEGLHRTVEEHYKSEKDGSVRADNAGVNLDFKFGLGWGKKVKKPGGAGGMDSLNVNGAVNGSPIVPFEVVDPQ